MYIAVGGFITASCQTKPIHPLIRFGSTRDATVMHNAVAASVSNPYMIPVNTLTLGKTCRTTLMMMKCDR